MVFAQFQFFQMNTGFLIVRYEVFCCPSNIYHSFEMKMHIYYLPRELHLSMGFQGAHTCKLKQVKYLQSPAIISQLSWIWSQQNPFSHIVWNFQWIYSVLIMFFEGYKCSSTAWYTIWAPSLRLRVSERSIEHLIRIDNSEECFLSLILLGMFASKILKNNAF